MPKFPTMVKMETNLASTSGDLLLTPEQMQNMRANVTLKVHVFKGLAEDERRAKFESLKHAWQQFTDICQGEVDEAHIAKFADAIKGRPVTEDLRTDFVIVISASKYVLGYALASEDAVEHDARTLGIKLLCARKSSGVGTQLVRVSENVAKYLGCASIHLEAVPTAYGFYKSMGLSPFRSAKDACSPEHLDADAEKFELAIRAMADSFRPAAGSELINPRGTYDRFMNNKKTTETQRAVMSGILASRVIPTSEVLQWTSGVNRNWLVAQLAKIINALFTTNNNVPMAKCLLTLLDNEPANEPDCVVHAASGDILHCEMYMSD